MLPLILFGGFAAAMSALSWWLRRRDESGYPSSRDFEEDRYPEPGVQYRPLESPPSPPFD
jgi:hypothetical protein